jgi:hypothetical protein
LVKNQVRLERVEMQFQNCNARLKHDALVSRLIQCHTLGKQPAERHRLITAKGQRMRRTEELAHLMRPVVPLDGSFELVLEWDRQLNRGKQSHHMRAHPLRIRERDI